MPLQPTIDREDRAIATAFSALQLIGAGGLLIVVLTAALCKRIKRWSTWYSFCASWILSSLSYSLLALAGQQFKELPNRTLCLAQAGLIYATPPLTICTTLSFTIHILLRLRFAKSDATTVASTQTILVLLAAPYSVWAVILIGVLLFTSHNMDTLEVTRSGTYCHSTESVWSEISFTVVIAAGLVIVATQIYLARFIYRNPDLDLNDSHLFTTAVRAVVFGSISLLNLIIAVVCRVQPKRDFGFDLVLAIFPILALATFGTQADLIQAYAFWRHRAKYAPLTGEG